MKRDREIRSIVVASAAILVVAACAACAPSPSPATATSPAPTPEKFVLSLDWVPNTNHTGFFVAKEKGWYAEVGLDVEIQIPSDPAAALKQVAYGNTDAGVSFQEEVTVARANDIPVVSLGAIIQHNTSAFVSLKSSGIVRARDIEGKRYAAYGQIIERPILSRLMSCDGGDINRVEFIDVGFDIFPALVHRSADVAWIFLGWDGVQAEIMGVELNIIPLYGSCVPDYYTPVVIAGETTIARHPDRLRRFMKATSRGYEYAITDPGEATDILLRASPETEPELARRSQMWLSPRYKAEAARWGEQKLEVWQELVDLLLEHGQIPKAVDAEDAFTNDFLPQ